MKNSNDTTGNRAREPPACSAVPQPTAPPRAPQIISVETQIRVFRSDQEDEMHWTTERASRWPSRRKTGILAAFKDAKGRMAEQMID